MLIEAVAGHVPLLRCHTEDTIHIAYLLGQILPNSRIAPLSNLGSKSAVKEAEVYYHIGDYTKSNYKDLYIDAEENEYVVIFINTNCSPEMLDVGLLIPTKNLVYEFLLDNFPSQLAEDAAPYLHGMSYQVMKQVLSMCSVYYANITVESIRATKDKLSKKPVGIVPVDTRTDFFFEVPKPLHDWIETNGEYMDSSVDHRLTPKGLLLWGKAGCVDKDTEYLTPEGWLPVSEYSDGDYVLQWNPDGTTKFVRPSKYTKVKASTLTHIKTKTVDMMLSQGHRVPYLTSKSLFGVKSTKELLRLQSFTIPRYFTDPNLDGLPITDNQIRLLIMQTADSYIVPTVRTGFVFKIRVKKQEKIDRVKELLDIEGIDYKCLPQKTGYTEYVYHPPQCIAVKDLSMLWCCSSKQLKIVFDEITKWDGSVSKRKNVETLRFTGNKRDCDLCQYVFSSVSGNYASITEDTREYKKEKLYNVALSNRSSSYITVKKLHNKKTCEVIETETKDGFQYCFTVPSSYWLARRGNKIFPTGNTGKTELSKHIARQWGMPLFLLDINSMLSKWQGEAESHLNLALQTFDTESPCVVLFDEVEKLFNVGSDNDTSQRLLSKILWWLQLRESKVFVVMTCNNMKTIPPELYRAGRVSKVHEMKGIPKGSVDQFVRLALLSFGIKPNQLVKHIKKMKLNSNAYTPQSELYQVVVDYLQKIKYGL